MVAKSSLIFYFFANFAVTLFDFGMTLFEASLSVTNLIMVIVYKASFLTHDVSIEHLTMMS